MTLIEQIQNLLRSVATDLISGGRFKDVVTAEDGRQITYEFPLATGMAWAETPPSRTRHLVSNVEILEQGGTGELRVRSNFLIYRSHLEYDYEIFSGYREDTLRPAGESWQICRRDIILDQSVVTQKNLGIFF